MDILSDKIYEIDDSCYFIYASVDNPHIFIRFKGVVKNKRIFKDSVTYFVKLTEVIEERQAIKTYLHRNRYRVWHVNADRGDIVEFNCFESMLNMSTFNSSFSKKLTKYLLPVPSVFAYDTIDEMQAAAVNTISIMKTELKRNFDLLSVRENDLK